MLIKLNKTKDGVINYKYYKEENSKRILVDKGVTTADEVYEKLLGILNNSRYVYDVNSSKYQFFIGNYEENKGCVNVCQYTLMLDERLSNDMQFAALLNKLVRIYIDRMAFYNANVEEINKNKKYLLSVCNGAIDYSTGHTASIDKEYANELKQFIDENKSKILSSDYWRSEDIIPSKKTATNKFWFVIAAFITCLVPPILFVGGLINIPVTVISFLLLATSTMLVKDKYVISEYEDSKKTLENFRNYLDTCDDGFEPLGLTKKISPSDFTKVKVKEVKKVDFEPLVLEDDKKEISALNVQNENDVEFEDVHKLTLKP